jgi:hypothetical protein
MSEFTSPLLLKPSENADKKQYICVRAPCDIVIDEFYIGDEVHKLEPPHVVKNGYQESIAIARDMPPLARDASVGVIATVINDRGEAILRCPIRGIVVGELEPAPLALTPMATHIVRFRPESPQRRGPVCFKRFDIQDVNGNLDAVDLNDMTLEVSTGRTMTMLLCGAVPLSIACKNGALKLMHAIEPGRTLDVILSNRSRQPITLYGGIVFEEIDDRRPIMPNLSRGTKGAN